MMLKNKPGSGLVAAALVLAQAVAFGRQAPCDNATVSSSLLRCAFNARPMLPPPLTSGKTYVSVTDLTQTPYPTFLYPNQNTVPAAHRASGDTIAAAIQPLDANGNVDLVNGKILAIAEGMSNAMQQMQGLLLQHIQNNPAVNPKFQFVNLSEGGCNLTCWRDKGVGPIDPQVQIVFMKHSNNFSQFASGAPVNPRAPFLNAASKRFPYHADTTRGMLKERILDLKIKYPNLKLLFLASRTYAGWTCSPAAVDNNREPVAFEEGFSVKWLIESQITGTDPMLNFSGPNAKAPWMAWGPYLWDTSWPQDWFEGSGTHPCATAVVVIAKKWYDFLMTDSASRPWFRDNAAPTVPANVSAKVGNANQATLSWSAVTDNSGSVKYRVFRGGALLKVTLGTSYVDNGLLPGMQYCYTVSAADSAGNESMRSNQACVTIIPTDVSGKASGPLAFQLSQNHPNPFGRPPAGVETEIRFQIPENEQVAVRVYNLFGEEIRVLTQASYPAGSHVLRWDGKDQRGNTAASGVYFYQFRSGGWSRVMKMTLMR